MGDDITNCGDLDERLAPYVDGQATPELRRAVEAHLAACPPCRKHAEAEVAVRQALREHRQALKDTAPAALRTRCEREAEGEAQGAKSEERSGLATHSQFLTSKSQFPASKSQFPTARSAMRRWVPLSLAATLLLAVGGVVLFGLNDRVEALGLTLAMDHVKCFAVRPTAPIEPADAAQHWRQDQGWPITVPRTDPAEQLCLIGLRRCFSADGRVAHMMYTWHGAPLSVYVVQQDVGRDGVVDSLGREAVIWRAQGRTYAVVADGHPAGLDHIVDYMKARAR